MGSRGLAWLGYKELIRVARALDYGVSEIFLGDFRDLLILFGLDDMGIHVLKIRVDLAFRRGRKTTTLLSFIGLSHGDDVPDASIQRSRF